MASIGERHNYAECYTQEIINEAHISFARILGLQLRVMLMINTIYFFHDAFTLKWNLVPRERFQEIRKTMILAFIKKKACYM